MFITKCGKLTEGWHKKGENAMLSAFFKSTAENVITLTIELFLKKKSF
jgi:hypothetical protein